MSRRGFLWGSVCFFLFFLLFSVPRRVEAASYTPPSKSYSIRSLSDSDRVLAVEGETLFQADWAGGSGQYFRLQSTKVGGVSGYRILSVATGKAVTPQGVFAGANVTLAKSRADICQLWKVRYMRKGSIEFICVANTQLALSVKGGSKEPGTGLALQINKDKAYQNWVLAPGTIKSALIGTNHKTVTVKGTFTRVMPSDDGRIYLLALPPYSESPLSAGRVVASVNAATKVTIKANLNAGTADSLLQKKLFLARKYKGYYLPITNGYYITNPERASSNNRSFPKAETKKGLKLVLSDAALRTGQELNTSHVVVDFPIEAFLNGYGYSYEYEGKNYQFSTAITGYANRLREVRAMGAVVTGIFYLSNRSFTDCILPTAVSGIHYRDAVIFALNTANEGRKRLEALFSCLAEVFTKKDILVANWVYGNEVDQYNVYHYAGELSYFQYHEALAEGFRMFNTAVKSKWQNARTYLSLDHNWNLSFRLNGTYPGIQLTEDFDRDLRGEGAVHWDMAMHPYPSPEMDCRFWKRSFYVTDSGYTQQVTMANAKAFCAYIKATYGQDVHIIMSETGICAYDQYGTEYLEEQAAAVALAYYLAEFDPNIDMIGFHREMDEAGSAWRLGLYEYDGYRFLEESARPAATVFRYMDTPERQVYVDSYAKTAGYEDWPAAVSSFGLVFDGTKCDSHG